MHIIHPPSPSPAHPHPRPSVCSRAMGFFVVVGAVASVGMAGTAAGQTGPSLMLAPWSDQARLNTAGDVLFIPTETNGPGSPDLDLTRVHVVGRVRPEQTGDRKLTFGYALTHLDLDTADAALPERLTDASLAVGAALGDFHAFDHDWNLNATAGAGFASSNTFDDIHGLYFMGSLFASASLDDRTSLVVGLDYDGNRTVFPDLPLPAIALAVKHSDTVRYTLGFPVSSITWTPDDRWTLQASTTLATFDARASFMLDDRFTLFGEYGGTADAFHVAGDTDNRRLFYTAQHLEAGVVVTLTDSASLTVAGGLAFQQEFERGFDLRDTTTVRELDDAAYLRVGGSVAF